MRKIATFVSFLGIISCGCGSEPAPQFSPSEEVQALVEDIEDEEEKQVYLALQEKISEELNNRCGTPSAPKMLGKPDMDPAQLKAGAAVYMKRCVQCHGVTGDGQGEVADYLSPRPRDYRKGVFKFTSTPYGAKPRRSDLMRTVRHGVSGTSMPAFDRLSNAELEAVVDYVLALTHRGELEMILAELAADEGELDDEVVEEEVESIVSRWREAESQFVLPVTAMPTFGAETVAAGRELFLKQACNKCHGLSGRGGFYGKVEVSEDAWGHKTAAADLTSGMFHGGGRPIDIYRRIYSGINGTPMPGFASAFAENPDAIWHLVHFIKDTGERRRKNEPPYDFAKEAGIEVAPTQEPQDDAG